MGGGVDDRSSSDSSPSGGEFYVDEEIPLLPPPQIPSRLRNAEGREEVEDHHLAFGSFDGANSTSHSSEFDVNERRNQVSYREILKCYNLHLSSESLTLAKEKIRSYYPGLWIEEVGGAKSSEYHVPRTTCLILIGPKGSGKSSLINRISKMFEDDEFASERAQVTFNSSNGDGTYFLSEYMVPRRSTSFCLYDTRSLSSDPLENTQMVRRWMTKGVRHGELVIRESDDSDVRKKMKYKARWKSHSPSAIRAVNFTIFVVSGVTILKSLEGKDDHDGSYMDMVAATYNLPYLSFRDDKPVVVVTHGDLLSVADRARIRVHLGERLGIPPMKQIFDIPERSDPLTESTIINMIRYSLEHADRNLPRKKIWLSKKVSGASTILRILHFCIIVVLAVILAIVAFRHRGQHHRTQSHVHIDWPSIRHMWLG